MGVELLADTPCHICKRLDVCRCDVPFGAIRRAKIRHEEKPVSAPSDIPSHLPNAGHAYRDARGAAKAWHIVHLDSAIRSQARLHRPDRGIDLNFTARDVAAVGERGDEPDCAVPAHADVADIVEEDDAHLAVGPMGFA